MSCWRPIETAPNDGTLVLIFSAVLRVRGRQCVAYWEDGNGLVEWWHVSKGKHGPFPLCGPSPTHWMPLPKPPTDSGTSVCSECGNVLPLTKAKRRASRAKTCAKCRSEKWRQKNPERIRKLWRDAKSRERNPE